MDDSRRGIDTVMRYLIALVILTLFIPRISVGANRYVDASCANNGNGSADQCAGSPGGAGAYQDVQSALDVAVAGDVVLVKAGTYTTSYNGADPRETGGYHFTAAGTSGNPITLRSYQEPNTWTNKPLLRNASSQTTNPGRPTITCAHFGYLIIEGLYVEGSISCFGGQPNLAGGIAGGPIVRYNEVTYGWMPGTDGNWSGIFVQDYTDTQVYRNYIHDIVRPSGDNQSSASCLKVYNNKNMISEYNTCKAVNISESQAGGIDDKADVDGNIHRYWDIQDVPNCLRFSNQVLNLATNTGAQVYGNLCKTTGYNVRVITNSTNFSFYNNTFTGGCLGFYSDGPTVTSMKFYNNIMGTINGGACGERGNFVNYNSGIMIASPTDYNVFTGGENYKDTSGTTNTSLASHRTFTSLDAGSTETACSFQNAAGGDYRLAVGSPCLTFGHVGGLSGGAVVAVGYEGVGTACVGHLCGVSGGGGGGSKIRNGVIPGFRR